MQRVGSEYFRRTFPGCSIRCGRLGLTSPTATFSAHTASPHPPLSRTQSSSRAASRCLIAPRTTSAHGLPAWGAPRSRTHRSIPVRQRQWSHAPREQSLTRLLLELLDGRPQIPAHELRVPIDPVEGARHDVYLAASIVRAKGSVQSGIATVRVASRHAASIIS